MKFLDTSALLELQGEAFSDKVAISSITLQELESIKTSASKEQNVKYRARKAIKLIINNEDKISIIPFNNSLAKQLAQHNILLDNNDGKIIMCALEVQEKTPWNESFLFLTNDLCCYELAKMSGLNAQIAQTTCPDYMGYRTFSASTEEQLAQFYQDIFKEGFDWSQLDLTNNEYLLIKDSTGKIIDSYRFQGGKLDTVSNAPCFESKMLGKVKAKDPYQAIAMHSLANNKITMLRGPAGTGKSYLTLGYLFSQLDRGKISKIIIFCNTVATAGSAKLGYYPGDRTTKLLDSQIGNFLSSKFGDKMAVEDFISSGKLELIPMSDIRGYDTTGLNAGIYITEAQNLDIELMRLALQRIGDDCICILDGDDESQVDLPLYSGTNNGMKRVSEIFRGDDIYGEVQLQTIYRSKIAQLAQLL